MPWAGRRAGRRLLRLLLLAELALLYNEYLVYYLVLSTCPAPASVTATATAPAPATTTVMVLADTHLLGRRYPALYAEPGLPLLSSSGTVTGGTN